MDSLVLLNIRDELLLEHNWKGRSFRAVVDSFISLKARYAATHAVVPPVVEVSRCLVLHIVTGSITLVCIASKEVDAAYVLELLHRLAAIFEEYFGLATATTELLVNNLDTVTELLCEMIDDGQPLTTECNGVRDIVLPPSIMNKLMNVTGMQGKADGQGQLSSIPWRRAKVKYTNNEIFVDIRETLTATVDKQGRFVYTDVAGQITCTTKLSGVPEVILEMKPAKAMGYPLFHPAINLDKFDDNPGLLSFIPPDGPFTLLSYSTELSTNSSSPLPFSAQFVTGKAPDTFEVIVSTRAGAPDVIAIEVPLPASCRDVRVLATKGDTSLVRERDEASPVIIRWLISGVSSKGAVTNKISLSVSNVPRGIRDAIYARVAATMTNTAISGLKVDSLKMHRVGDWKPYKGVKYMTKVDMVFRAR